MPVTRILRLAAVGLFLAACGGSVPSAAPPDSPVPSLAPTPSSTKVAVSLAPAAPTSGPATTPAPSASTAPAATRSPAVSASSPTATHTSAPTRRPTPAPSPAPTRAAQPTKNPTPPPTLRPTPAPVVLSIEARDFRFSPDALTGPAGTPFAVAFTNADADIPHNVTIATDAGAPLFGGRIISGVASVTYVVPAIPAGTYRLGCIVHPAMIGMLTLG